jgi:hypothetical protein
MDPTALPPYQGISSPLEVFGPFIQTINVPGAISVVAIILFIIWLVYTIVASYHLIRYGHRSAVAIPAIITHVIVSLVIALYTVSGLT